MHNRRHEDRHHLLFQTAVLDADTETVLGQLVNLSGDGLMLASDRALEAGRRYHLRVPLPVAFDGHEALRLSATIAWSAPATGPAFHRNGLRDLELPAEQNEAFRHLLDDYRLRAAAAV